MAFTENAESFGGADERVPADAEKISCNKPDHFLRSFANQSNHMSHSKEILGPQLCSENDISGRLSHTWICSHLPIIRSRNQK